MIYNNQDLYNPGDQVMGIKGFGSCTIKQYQKEALKILSEVDKVCRKNHIPYFLMYGTLLGAVRHHSLGRRCGHHLGEREFQKAEGSL